MAEAITNKNTHTRWVAHRLHDKTFMQPYLLYVIQYIQKRVGRWTLYKYIHVRIAIMLLVNLLQT